MSNHPILDHALDSSVLVGGGQMFGFKEPPRNPNAPRIRRFDQAWQPKLALVA